MATDLEGSFLILRKIKYGEADLILHALSAEGEKMSFLARGALKSKKRFGGGILEPTHHVRFIYSSSGQSEIHTLKEAQLINGFENLRLDYDRLHFALMALDSVARVSLEGDQGSESLYNLLGHLLKSLEKGADLLTLKVQFYLKFLRQQGVLESEEWMRPFMAVPLSENAQLAEFNEIAEEHIGYLEKVIKNYVETAST